MTAQTKLLIANRGEIAVRIADAAFALNIPTVSLYTEDDPNPLHRQRSDGAVQLPGRGVAAWLNMEAIVAIAQQTGCSLIHPGYGFLSENGMFARLVEQAGLTFIGADPEDLDLLGNKVNARKFAADMGIPVLPGRFQAATLEDAQHFLASINGRDGLMLKAVAGGGGRGMRAVRASVGSATNLQAELAEQWAHASSEAERAFGDGSLYFEKLITGGRHIEVQIIGDGSGDISHLYTRDCSIQRRFQKLIEIAPAPNLDPDMAHALQVAAVELMSAIKYAGAGTVEFLVEDETFYFIEANPRIQVEHTVTEEITGVDLVQFQIRQAMGEMLGEMGLSQPDIPPPLGMAMQCRINAEQILPPVQPEDGLSIQAASGTLTAFDMPSGRGVRVNTGGYSGYTVSPLYDSLLAKLIVYSPSERFSDLTRLATRHLSSVNIGGLPTNLGLLQTILANGAFSHGQFDLSFMSGLLPVISNQLGPAENPIVANQQDRSLVTDHWLPAEGQITVTAPMPGSILSVDVATGDSVMAGQTLAILEAMKMETVIHSPTAGQITEVMVETGDIVTADQVLCVIDPVEVDTENTIAETVLDLDRIRPDLQELFERRSIGQDANRPQAVEKRRAKGQRTARENIFDLVDPGSFAEYGSAAIAAQRSRRTLEDLIQNTPADGLITGTASINGHLFPSHQSRAMVMGYDYTVLAGTQGAMNHKKMDRMLHLAEERNIPLVIFAEGGGGRPGDVDVQMVAGLDVMTFALFARLSGKMPRVSIVSGYCFAGNAALAGAADVIIATENASLGMGGPAMIAGGGLGNYHPKEVGPMSFQTTNGVVDVLVKDEQEAVAAAKQYLSYFQGAIEQWDAADQRELRHLIPENRRRMYDMRKVISTLADTGSVLELRRDFGVGIITSLVRVEGRPLGLIANNPTHLGGAIDSDAADKCARFMQLCDCFGIPLLSLVDTPGIMVGPDAEATGTVRHAARMFVTGSKLTVPFISIVLRKGYGLGAQAMCGGSFTVPVLTVAWPTGEFGAMGLEGAVQLGYRKELEAIESDEERQALYEKMVAHLYERGKALSMASFLEIDEVVDPAETRGRIVAVLDAVGGWGKGRPFVDTW